MSEFVLDASALLALLNAEPGSQVVAHTIPGAAMSAVNLSEVIGKLAEAGMPEPELRHALTGLGLDVHPFDHEDAYTAGLLRPHTRTLGLSVGDRACLGLGLRLTREVITADRSWKALEPGVKIRVIR